MTDHARVRHPIATITVEGVAVTVTLTMEHDGVEHVGRLWFESDEEPGEQVSDRGVFPGRTPEAVLARARSLAPLELRDRWWRGLSERRRYHPLRRATGELLGRIRHLNHVAAAMRSGLIDSESAAAELAAAEAELHAMVRQLRDVAGDEDEG